MEEDAMLARFPRRTSLTLVGVVALVVAIANPAAAPPGDLDPTFDGDGRVTTDFGAPTDLNEDEGRAVAIQADGKIVAAGYAITETGLPGAAPYDFALARYNPDGSLDPTFDGDGRVTTDFIGTEDRAFAVAIQADGKIVAAGFALTQDNEDFALARYNPDGSLDPTFDADGKVITDFALARDEARALAIQPDGKVVAAGFAFIRSFDFALARYNPDGSLDPSFAFGGGITTDFGPPPCEEPCEPQESTDSAHAVAIQGDGKIIAAGSTIPRGTGSSVFALARYNTDGTLDSTFDGDGKVITDFAADWDEAFGLALQGDGKIVAAGRSYVSGITDFALARYNTDGSLDSTFDGDGKVTTDFAGGFDEALGVAIQGDGKIVAAGFATVSGTLDFALARYNTDGSLDTVFSGDGTVTTDFAGSEDRATAVAIQVDGKIVAAGFAVVSDTRKDFALARYTVCRRTSRPSSIPFCP
jgi:uncharacterized delta-60 repeat protein